MSVITNCCNNYYLLSEHMISVLLFLSNKGNINFVVNRTNGRIKAYLAFLTYYRRLQQEHVVGLVAMAPSQ
jgi:hypothetical protein